MEFKTYALSDLYSISSGLSKKREEFGFGNSFLTFKEVFHNPFVPDKLLELANTTIKEQEKCSIKEGDVFLTRTSEKLDELGLSSVALKDYPNATFNGFTKRLRPNKLCKSILLPKYAAFYFRSEKFRNQVTSFSSMTTRASLNNEMISKLTIDIPSIFIQKKIIEVMWSLLEKEKENISIIENLEQLSQTLFKHWFIDFEFPNEQGDPYKSSDGEMVGSELGEIPKGWIVKSLGEIAEVKGGKRLPKGEKIQEKVTNHPYIRVKDFTNRTLKRENIHYITPEIHEKIKNYTVSFKDIYISVAGTVGLTGLIPKVFSGANLTENANKITPIDNTISKYFILEFLNSGIGKEQIRSKVVGSTQPKLPLYAIKDIKIIIPEKEYLLNEINNVLEKCYLQKEILEDNNQILKDIRDTLLPKFLSGEIEIPDELEV
ncbi:restriction endonuclease subunit S [Bacillus wiedmannii]|uniref:restriction endonuclease subunit S n=1 Tax=Bacillus wiedmannii TaxID=1890302 RepID=UPI000BEB84B8|nr:restriction endonuclease subunit S [Bacillus wiedmannii]PEA43533.1 restriction endonuclease subunit S [Bacillus wiedmannii]